MEDGKTFPARSHGGADGEGVPLHDFSTNSNACGPCPQALLAVQQADASAYPDSSYTGLRAQLAAFHGVPAQQVLLAGSASEFIFRVTSLAAQRTGAAVWLPPYSYGDYAHAARAWKLPVVADPAQAQLRWACDPSSPLGKGQAALDQLIDSAALCVLDRAYEPLRLGDAPAWRAEVLQQFWQLWTPNKALGLTGVRAAYVVAPPGSEDLVAQLESLAPSWPVGAHGVAMLQAWALPTVQAWLAGCLPVLHEWKSRQIALCEALGWTCLPSEANFFCAQPALPKGTSLQDALVQLRRHGIKLRDTTSFGLPGHVRLGVMPPAAQDALHNAWQHIEADS
ncbi:aminotransferase class I/II-fold pyridoxal phosphate-dependent enzyme [Polaromonas sp. A23]|uniref:aminotransferase class I/II-fold pyridoxal phosphate-dependent enzyme n=1 Tax=Polaromonas sp. A23 TaxID=1944133 RepID=UPI000985A4B1|nr:aminotransferase class I/II-fold pyridoxal phosphate-dependent enzyme [Polaromonas sp. A23]OOG42978.1 aminotransferase [Polaromonas sp. A23]